MRARTVVPILALLLLLSLPALAVSGMVYDEKDKPLGAATVCIFNKNVELECTKTGVDGRFELPTRASLQIRVIARGFLPETRVADGEHRIKLKPTPVLSVRLVDAASGEPIDNGEIFVVYPSSTRKGPFPVGRGGVRISRVLQPGDVRILAVAEGYRENIPRPMVLEAGRESDLVLELVRVD